MSLKIERRRKVSDMQKNIAAGRDAINTPVGVCNGRLQFAPKLQRCSAAGSIPAIAREAGTSTGNVYVYFKSKLEILYTLYEPWLKERLDKLDRSLRAVKDSRERFQRLLTALWRDLPRENNGFANNVMQALSTTSGEGYTPALRELFQMRVAEWIEGCLPIPRQGSIQLAGVLLMAFDGYAMNAHLSNGISCDAGTLRLFRNMLTGRSGIEFPPQLA
jgi:AcrR family transcriptional regulator